MERDMAAEAREGDILFKQSLEIWINPEVERRQQAGLLSNGFVLNAAQIIWTADGSPEVRLNEEVRAVMRFRAARALKSGEHITEDDIADIHDVELTSQDANAAHETIIRHRGCWWIKWDCRYNASRVADHLDVAREFLDAAAFSLQKGNLHAFVENLFAVAELLAKGQLLLLPDAALLKAKKHAAIRVPYNHWGKLGNTDLRFTDLLNRATRLRECARYLRTPMKLDMAEAKQMLRVAEEMFEALRARAPQRRAIA